MDNGHNDLSSQTPLRYFENYIKRSLLFIGCGICMVIVILGWMLKVMMEKECPQTPVPRVLPPPLPPPPPPLPPPPEEPKPKPNRKIRSREKEESNDRCSHSRDPCVNDYDEYEYLSCRRGRKKLSWWGDWTGKIMDSGRRYNNRRRARRDERGGRTHMSKESFLSTRQGRELCCDVTKCSSFANLPFNDDPGRLEPGYLGKMESKQEAKPASYETSGLHAPPTVPPASDGTSGYTGCAPPPNPLPNFPCPPESEETDED